MKTPDKKENPMLKTMKVIGNTIMYLMMAIGFLTTWKIMQAIWIIGSFGYSLDFNKEKMISKMETQKQRLDILSAEEKIIRNILLDIIKNKECTGP